MPRLPYICHAADQFRRSVKKHKMESKIVIDVDSNGIPQIKINYQWSEDVRDRLIGRFFNKMGIPNERGGFWAYVRKGAESCSAGSTGIDQMVCVIEPLDRKMLSQHYNEIQFNVTEYENSESVNFLEKGVFSQMDELASQNLDNETLEKWEEVKKQILFKTK